MRGLVIVAVLAALAPACGKQLNPAWCADHPDDPACREVPGDAAPLPDASPTCAGSAECPGTLVCDPTTPGGRCVLCTQEDRSNCSGSKPACSEDNICVGCAVDADCASDACLPEGSCADAADVLYASPAGGGTACTAEAPCTFEDAIMEAVGQRNVIRLASGTYGPVVIAKPVRVLGTGATISRASAGPAVDVGGGGTVDLVGLQVTGGAPTVRCQGATLIATRLAVSLSDGYGVESSCTLTLTRSRLSLNTGGALRITGGDIAIRNNVIFRNGSLDLQQQPVDITASSGTFHFNTVAFNTVKGNTEPGVTCNGDVDADGNLITNNDAGGGFNRAQVRGTCRFESSYVERGSGANTIGWVDITSDFHLTPGSPISVLNVPGVTCTGIDDLDGQQRPKGTGCDLGADELLQ